METEETKEPPIKQRKTSESDIFYSKFESINADLIPFTLDNFENAGQTIISNVNIDNSCDTTNDKRQPSWQEYVSSSEKEKKRKASRFKPSKRSTIKSNKSVQTLLTIENLSILTDLSEFIIAESKNSNNEHIKSFKFRLSKTKLVVSDKENKTDNEKLYQHLSNDPLDPEQWMRHSVINWLIILDDNTGCDTVTLQSAIIFLDRLASLGPLPDPAVTCAAACYWIAAKLESSRTRGAIRIAKHSAGAFTAKELVLTEMKVLAALQFPRLPGVAANEVEVLAAQLTLGTGIIQVVDYLCLCALLREELASLPPARLAAAALTTTVTLLDGPGWIFDELRKLPSPPNQALEQEIEAIGRDVSLACLELNSQFYVSNRHREAALHLTAAYHKRKHKV